MIKLKIDNKFLNSFAQKWNIKRVFLFGSALNESFDPKKSDIDIIVEFKEDSSKSLFDLVEMKEELEKYFSRKVDLLTLKGIQSSENHLRKENILGTMEVIYDQAA